MPTISTFSLTPTSKMGNATPSTKKPGAFITTLLSSHRNNSREMARQ